MDTPALSSPPDWNSLSDAPPPATSPVVSGTTGGDIPPIPGGVQGDMPPAAPNNDPATNGEVPTAAQISGVPDWNSLSDVPPKIPGVLDNIKSGLKDYAQGAVDTVDGLARPFVPGYAALTAGVDQADRIVPDVATMVGRVTSIGPGAYDQAATAITGQSHVTAYDWWNRNMIQPGINFSNSLDKESNQLADATGVIGKGMQAAGNVAGLYLEIEPMATEAAGTAISSALPREGFGGGLDVLKEQALASIRNTSIPTLVAATKTNAAVYEQTGDPLAAVKAGITAAATTAGGLAIPMGMEGKLLYRAATGALSGAVTTEASREINNAALPDNMQQPFAWGETGQGTAISGVMAAAFGNRAAENYQLAYLRSNAIRKAADGGDGVPPNVGAQRTADIIDTLSQVTNNINNPMIDSAVYGVTVSNAKMAKTHVQLQSEDPRYAAIFKATQSGPAPVDPATGEQIARDAYANEVSTNASFDKYSELTGKKAQSLQAAKQAAINMATAHQIVTKPELDVLSRWAAYDQPSQAQFNAALQETIDTKKAPDFAHAKYGTDFDQDGIPNEQAFQRDSAARPDAFDTSYAPNAKVESALHSSGINYYRRADGTLTIRGHNTEYNTRVISHVFDQTGIKALQPGETYGKQSSTADDAEQEVRPEVARPGGDQGNEAATGQQAEAGQPQQPHGQQNGDEGHGQVNGAWSVVGHEGSGPVAQNPEDLTARAAPVAGALAKAGVTTAHVDPTGRVVIHPDATPQDATAAIDVAERDAAEHPESDRRTITDKERGNGHYPMGKLMLPSPDGDVPVNIETPKGAIRHSLPGSAKNWSIKARDPIGYIPGTIGADGDGLDVILGPKAYDPTRPVAVISQHDPRTGAFDEVKTVMGARGRGEAMAIYGRQYPTGMVDKLLPKGKANIVMMSRAKFHDYWNSGAVDVPPHPISGAPLLSLRQNGHFDGETGNANMDAMQEKVDAVNAKHGTKLNYDRTNDTVAGDIPLAKADAIHRSFSRIDGYAGSKINGKPIGQQAEAAGSRETGASNGGTASRNGNGVGRVQRSGGQEAGGVRQPEESPRAAGTEKAVSDAPVFHEGQSAHPVSAVGVHYSNTPGLKELDPTMAGTGSAGGERRANGVGRFGKSSDPLTAMTSFYVRSGEKLPEKESIVSGQHPYEARLNNLYDTNTDPDGIFKAAEANGTRANRTLMLEQIHDAGYDGILYNALPGQPKGQVATVFGVNSKIPVKDVGTSYLAKRPQTKELRLGKTEQEEQLEKLAKLKEKLADMTAEAIKEKLKGSSKEGENPKLMFAGERAATGDKGALAYAQKIEQEEKASGKSDSEIEAQTHGMTGWSRGTDGKWNFEIDDSKSALKPGVMDKDSEVGKQLYSEKGAPLSAVLDHPSLYQAYPHLADSIHVRVDPHMSDDASAIFDDETNTATFHDLNGYDKTGDESVHSILLHETQHAIQYHEDHAVGGNPFMFMEPMRQQKIALMSEARTVTGRMDEIQAENDDFKNDPEWKALLDHAERLHDLIMQSGLRDYSSMMSRAQSQYMKLAGENQAYNTQDRQGMSAQERLRLPPSTTENTPRSQQIIRFKGEDGNGSNARMHDANQASALFEVAPDPHNKDLTERFAKLSPERRAQITHELNDSITPDILRTIGVKADHFLSTFGGYEDQVNPSLGAQFRESITKEDAYKAAAAAGHVFNQDSVIVLGKGMGDKTGLIRIDMHGAKDYNAISRLYGQLRKDLGDKVGGFTGHDTGIDILNFNKDVDTATLKDEIKASIAKLPNHNSFSVTHGETEAHFISKEGNDHGESYGSWLRSKSESKALDVLRERASQKLEQSIQGNEGASERPGKAVQSAREKQVASESAAHQASVDRGNQDAERLGLRDAAHEALGDSKHVVGIEFVHDEAGLPADLRGKVEDRIRGQDGMLKGVFDPPTGRVFVLTKNVKTPEDAAWVAAHEVIGHKGYGAWVAAHSDVRVGGKDATEALDETTDRALTNPTVAKMADSISRARDVSSRREAGQEALAELSAASRTKDWDRIKSEYGVAVPARMRQETKGVIDTFMRKAHQITDAIMQRATGKVKPFSNEDVRDLIENSHKQVFADEQASALKEARDAGLPDDTAPLMSIIPRILRRSNAPIKVEPRAPGESDQKWRARVLLKSRGQMKAAVSMAKAMDKSRQTVGRLDQRDMMAHLDREGLKSEQAFHGAQVAFDKMSDADNLKAMDEWENGQPVTSPEHAIFFNAMKDGFKERLDAIENLKPGAMKGFIQNYLPHIWKDPLAAKKFIDGVISKRPLAGNKNFMRDRFWMTTKEGMDSGLQPISTNPVDLVLRRFGEMDKYIGLLRLMDTQRAHGWLRRMDAGERVPEGFARVDDPSYEIAGGMQGYYAVPSGIARDINNYLKPGLNQYKGWRAFRAVQNGIVQSELGWSGFHAGFTTLENLTLHLSTAAARFADGDLVGGMKTLVMSPLSIVTSPIEGRMLNKAWRDPSLASPETQAILSALEQGGAHQGMAQSDYVQAIPSFMRSIRRGELGDTALTTLPAVGQAGSWLIHNWLVPNQKMSARVTVFKQLLDHFAGKLGKDRGDYTGILDAMSPIAMKQIAARVVDIVDDRLGQMSYDNQFWNTNLRQAGQSAFLSLGWLVGEVRTVTGGVASIPRLWRPEKLLGALDKAGTISGATMPRLDFRLAYLMMLSTVMSSADALLQKGMTGQWPTSIKDLFYPRTGNKNPDGSNERLSLPSYWKDHYELVNHPVKTMANKINPIFSMVYQALTNQDYFGTEIRNPHAPAWKQAEQTGAFFAKAMAPFTYKNLQKSAASNGQPGESSTAKNLRFVGNAFGVNNASAAASRTDFQDFVAHNGNKGYGHERMTQEQMDHMRAMGAAEYALRSGQSPDFTNLSSKDRVTAERAARFEKPELQFKKLSFEDKLDAWDKATPDERKEYHLRQHLMQTKPENSPTFERLDEDEKAAALKHYRDILRG